MDFIKKVPKQYYLISLLVFVLCISIYVYSHFTHKKEDTLDLLSQEYITELVYKYNNNEYRVIHLTEKGERWLLVNNKPDKVLFSVSSKSQPILELPKPSSTETVFYTTNSLEGISYKLPIQETANHIAHLKYYGYKVEFQVNTPTYIELILSVKEERLRLIIQNDLLLIGEISEGYIPQSADRYLNSYYKVEQGESK